MAIVETMTFRLRPETDDAEFLQADRAVQVGFAYQQAGLVRRTTARDTEGGWIVVDLWESAAHADAMAERWEAAEAPRAFMTLVDEGSVDVRRYETLD